MPQTSSLLVLILYTFFAASSTAPSMVSSFVDIVRNPSSRIPLMCRLAGLKTSFRIYLLSEFCSGKVLIYSSSWPVTHYVAPNGLEIIILLPVSLER